MSGFWANDWLGKVEGQTLQMFKHDLLQVMNVTVTPLVDVRIHQCPPHPQHSSFVFQGRALSLPQQPLCLRQWLPRVGFGRLTGRMHYVYKQRLKNKTKQARKQGHKQTGAGSKSLAHVIFYLPGTNGRQDPESLGVHAEVARAPYSHSPLLSLTGYGWTDNEKKMNQCLGGAGEMAL